MKRILSLMAVLLSTIIYAQTTVTGTVVTEDNMPVPGANVVFDATTGAVSDFDGNFTLVVSDNPPFDLKISSIGLKQLLSLSHLIIFRLLYTCRIY